VNPDEVRFCPRCGAPTAPRAAGGRERPVCTVCGQAVYGGPAVGVAVIVQDADGKVLLGRRARGRYAGRWCIPCGYVEWGEEVRAAAAREFAEETGLEVEVGEVAAVHSNFHDPDRLSVGIWFRGRVVRGAPAPRDGELSALGYFDPANPPTLAFPTDGIVLGMLAEELRRKSGQ
jgi:8-oxo-dGTP diphosphatase